MSTAISRDEWLAALNEAGISDVDDQDALTVDEFGAMFGIDRQTADRRLKKLEAAGKAVKTRKRCAPHGRLIWYVAYKLV